MASPIRSLRRVRLDILPELRKSDSSPQLLEEELRLQAMSDEAYADENSAMPLDHWDLPFDGFRGLRAHEIAHYARARGYESRWLKGLFQGWRWFPLGSATPVEPEHLVPILGTRWAWNSQVAMRASAEAPGIWTPEHRRKRRRPR